MTATPLSLVIAAIAAWLAIGALGLVRPRNLALRRACLFPAGAAVGLALAGDCRLCDRRAAVDDRAAARAARPAVSSSRRRAVRVLPAAARGSAAPRSRSFPPAISAPSEGTSPGLICFQYHVFLAAMALVLVADDAYLFMVAWESMALSLVLPGHDRASHPGNSPRRVSCTSLIAHVGAIAHPALLRRAARAAAATTRSARCARSR